MTLPNERTRAVRNARNFLRSLLDPKKTPRIPKAVRRQAYWCLRHFPSDFDMIEAMAGHDVFAPIEKEPDEVSY